MFLFGIAYTKRITWQILIDAHDRLLTLSKGLEINYIDNRNIRETSFQRWSSFIRFW